MQTRKMVGANCYVAGRLRRDMTSSERLLWDKLRNRQLEGHKLRRQHPVERFVLDFYCAEAGVAVEVDGPVHRTRQQVFADADRQSVLERHGIRFLRVSVEEVENALDQVLDRIAAACGGHSPSPRARGEAESLPGG